MAETRELQELPQLSDADLTASEAPAGPRGLPFRRRGPATAAAALAAALLLVAGAVAAQQRGAFAAAAGSAAAEPRASLRHPAAAVVLAEEEGKAKAKAEETQKAEDEDQAEKPSAAEDKPKEEKKKACKLPHADDKPSLFCWAVMYPGDEALIKSQFTGRAGIFACNDYAVIGKEDVKIGTDDCGDDFHTWQENLPTVKKGHYGVDAMTSSWLNVPVFLLCWDRLLKSGKVWQQDFTVKMDPDAVFFPDRLGSLLAGHKGKPVFTTNCRYWGGDQVGKLFGAIEVLSKQAIGAYKGKKDTCKNLPWQGWGEDYWMQHCMNALGVPAVGMFDQVSDNTCPLGGGAPCSDGKKIVFHPRKDAGQWWECWKQSAGQSSQLVAK